MKTVPQKSFSIISTLAVILVAAFVAARVADVSLREAVLFGGGPSPTAYSAPMAQTARAAAPNIADSGAESPAVARIRAPEGVIKAVVASTSAEQEKGLGGRPALPADQGMLFPFQAAGAYGFWMKDMRFSLDIVWISSDKRVIGLIPGLSPATYPDIFYPPAPVEYVLELDSGGAAAHGIATGTQLVF